MKYLQNEKILLDKIIVMVYTISRKEKFFEIKKFGVGGACRPRGRRKKMSLKLQKVVLTFYAIKTKNNKKRKKKTAKRANA